MNDRAAERRNSAIFSGVLAAAAGSERVASSSEGRGGGCPRFARTCAGRASSLPLIL